MDTRLFPTITDPSVILEGPERDDSYRVSIGVKIFIMTMTGAGPL